MVRFRRSKIAYFIGVDEAGRGPIAGPVAVGVVAIPAHFPSDFFDSIKDSKQLSGEEREMWAKKAQIAREAELINYEVGFSSAEKIDAFGIVPAIDEALSAALTRLDLRSKRTCMFLDGALRGPKTVLHYRVSVRGDEYEPLISLASILAKVRRDEHMKEEAGRYPGYGFERHKGYGTKEHYQALKEKGLCAIHRKSFIRLPLP